MTTPEKSNTNMLARLEVLNVKKTPFSFRQLRYLAHLIYCCLSFSDIIISMVVKVTGFFFRQTVNSFVNDLCH